MALGINALPTGNLSCVWSATSDIGIIPMYAKGIFVASGADGILIGVDTSCRIYIAFRNGTVWSSVSVYSK